MYTVRAYSTKKLLIRGLHLLVCLGCLFLTPPGSPVASAWQESPEQPADEGTGPRAYLPIIRTAPHSGPWGTNHFGYTGLDNLGTPALAFDWVEIAGSGTEVGTDGYGWKESSMDSLGRQTGPIHLGMYFPAFDVEYNAVWIHDTGSLRFGNGTYTAESTVVKGLTIPGGFATGYYNYVLGQSHVYFKRISQPDRFVVEFRGLGVCCANGTADLEIILYPSGEIRIQYLQLGDHDPSRIQVGLRTIYNTDALVYADEPVAGRVIVFTYPTRPNHTYTPDEGRWYTYALPRQLSSLDTLLLGPGDSSLQTLFVGGPGMLLRSETGSLEWTAVTPSNNTTASSGANWNPRHYALSSDYHETGIIMAAGYALTRSANRGSSWAELDGPTGELKDIAFSPAYAADHTIVTVGVSGIWMSTDGGLTWQNRTPGLSDVNAIRFSPEYARDRTLWVTTYAGPLYRSTNAGASWAALGLPATGQPIRVQDLQPAPNYGTSHALFMLGRRDDNQQGSLYRSDNAGTSWTWLANVSDASRLVRVDPTDTTNRTLYLGSYGDADPLLRSQDGGTTWQPFSEGLEADMANVTAFAIQPETGRLFALLNTGLFSRTPGAPEWQRLTAPSPDLSVVQPGIGTNQAGNTVMLAGGYRSDDGGRTWAAHGNNIAGQNMRAVALSPDYADDGTAIALTDVALLRTTNGGANWSSQAFCVGNPLNGEQRIVFSPGFRDDHTVFVAACDHIARSRDGGVTWQTILSGEPTSIALSPDFAHDGTAFASSGGYYTTIYRSTDGGATWSSYPGPWTAGLLSVSPAYATDHTLYAAVNNSSSGGLWQSTDAGESWRQMPTTVSNYEDGLIMKPGVARPGSLFLANKFSYYGMAWLSDDEGQTWSNISSGLSVYGQGIAYTYHAGTDRIYRFCDGGMWWRAMGWR